MIRQSLHYLQIDAEELNADIASTARKREELQKQLKVTETEFKDMINIVLEFSDFATKYNAVGSRSVAYVHTKQPGSHIFATEMYPIVQLPLGPKKLIEELTYRPMFEEVIERYTLERRKPNPVLLETRSSDFCYLLTVRFEAIAEGSSRQAESHQLLREFKVLQHLWESYRAELVARKCGTDQLVGFPMLFEFCNVTGSSLYDFPKMAVEQYTYYDLHGKTTKICQEPVSKVGFGTDTKNIMSSLSYMAIEKVGPSLVYLVDLMQSQNRRFEISSALKVYDQILSRLMILHRYSIVHGDINPECLNFGCKEATNVLYISSFKTAVLSGSHSEPLPLFHDRFVSYLQARVKSCHFLCDLEAAFYVFLSLLLDRLPWDKASGASDVWDKQVANDDEARSNRKSRTSIIKEKFWKSNDATNWIAKNVTFEYSEGLYCNFSLDVLETLYAKMKECISVCSIMTPASFSNELLISGSAPNNCYFGMRRVIASYFRFESLSQSMKDLTCASKLAMLAKQDPKDRRVAWDLSYWCWNHLDTDPEKKKH